MCSGLQPETPISVNKRNFETACVKFLMTAWKQVALRDGLLSESVVNTLRNAMEVEQTVLHTWAYGKNADCEYVCCCQGRLCC